MKTTCILFLAFWGIISHVNVSAQIAAACNPSFTTACGGYRIYNFTFAGINNSPAATACGTSNYLSQVATVTAGQSTPYSVQMGLWMNYAIYADFNNDGDFNDLNEMLYASGSAPPWATGGMLTVNGNLTIPATVIPGSYRLRVLGAWVGPTLGATSACNTFNMAGGGNFHDYTLTVNAAVPCTPPAAPVAGPQSRCGPGPVILSAAGPAGTSLKWYQSVSGGTPLATGNTFTSPVLNTTTTYYVTADNGTCESTPRTPVAAVINAVPTVNIGNDTTICPGVSYILNATTPNAKYAWNTGDTTSSITVNAAGTYSVLVTVNGCGGSDARTIIPAIMPVNNLPALVDLCEGSAALLNAGNSGSTFLWTPGGATTGYLNVTAGGSYAVDITSADGCRLQSSTNVIIRPLPVPSAVSDTSICQGTQIMLDAGNTGYRFNWSTGDTLQTIMVNDSGSYSVTVTSPFECQYTGSTHVAFLPGPNVGGFNFVPLFYEELGKVKFSALNPTDVSRYEWDFGDSTAASDQAEPLHTYQHSGEFLVTLNVFNDCGSYSVRQSINVGLSTGIASMRKGRADVFIYPNPAVDRVMIQSKDGISNMKEISVINMQGQIVYRKKADSDRLHSFSVSGFAPGVYIIRVLTNDGQVLSSLSISK